MGRHPDTEIPADADQLTADGHLSPEVWARLVLARINKGDTGTLIARHESTERLFRFMQGVPICATSSAPDEDFTETMVATEALDPAKLAWIRKHTAADESEIEALIGAGTIQRIDVDAHHAIHIQHLIAATLAWPEGEFTWSPAPDIGDRFERSLLPQVSGVEGLITGILGGFDLAALHTYVDAADAGDFMPDSRMTDATPPAWVPRDLTQIHTQLGQGITRDDIAEALSIDPDRIAAMLWLLEATGWARRSHPPAALLPLGKVATIQAGLEPEPEREAPPSPPKTKAATRTTAAPKTETTTKARAAPEVAPKAAAPKKATPKKATPKAAASGKPAVPPAAAPTIDPKKALDKALRAVADSDFDTAYRLLSNIRKDRPSCPDTLAALGWTAWRTENLGTNAYDGPEDFLLLALTFNAAHPKALEYYARIAIEKGEKENARNRLLQVLKATPNAPWAEEALAELNPKGSKSGLRLWPKGRS